MLRRSIPLFGLLLLSTTFAVILAEAVLRVFGLAPTGGVSTVTESQFQEVPGIFAPGLKLVETRIPELAHEVTINSLGYRGPDFPREKDSSEFRVLFVGDSFVFGDFVDDGETLPSHLQRALEVTCPSVRVVNVGLGGSTLTEHIPLLRRAYELDPDFVIVLFSSNDVSDLRGTSAWKRLAANRAFKSRFPLSVVYPIMRRTALWNSLLAFRGRLRAARQAPPDVVRGARGDGDMPSDLRELRARYLELLNEMTTELREKGIPYLFTAFPSHHTVYETNEVDDDRWILETVSKVGIPNVELLSPLVDSGLGPTEVYLLPHDGHPSSTGYRMAAEVLAEAMRGMPSLAEACQSLVVSP